MHAKNKMSNRLKRTEEGRMRLTKFVDIHQEYVLEFSLSNCHSDFAVAQLSRQKFDCGHWHEPKNLLNFKANV